MFQPREYQQQSLESLRNYFQTCVRLHDAGVPDAANVAFYQCTLQTFGTGLAYQPIKELQGLPYVCIRIPTGGGKTFVACNAIEVALTDLLQADYNIVLWLVPSNAIREQTLNALRDRGHPYRQALEETLNSVTILDSSEALYISPSVLKTSTTIVVTTIQSLRVEETDNRKLYESSGSLMGHFSNLPLGVLDKLEKLSEGTPIYSFANVLKLHRPIVIIDEAHNARTDLSFTTLARFDPSCIIEFTATPDHQKSPSNVLYSVSASQLKASDMIKIPILLQTRIDWRELLGDSIANLNQLTSVAKKQRDSTDEYIRPIMLIQAQPHRGEQPITVDVVESCLINDFNIPREHIARATGTDREIEGIDILSEDCPIRFVITIQALREGWDCPFAYILCSVAEMSSGVAVEQILGRVMRLPYARRKDEEALNMAYAYAASTSFAATAERLIDGLVLNGFNRIEAKELMVKPEQADLGLDSLLVPSAANTVIVSTSEKPRLDEVPPDMTAKVRIDSTTGALVIKGPMTEQDVVVLKRCYETNEGKEAVDDAFWRSRWALRAPSPAEQGEKLSIPLLAYKQGSLPLEPFEETHFLDHMWQLSKCDALLTEEEFPFEGLPAQQAKIDVTKDSQFKLEFIRELHQQIRLLASDQGWTEADLVYWLDHSLPQRQDITQAESDTFIIDVMRKLINQRRFTLDQLVHDKYRLKAAVAAKIENYRRKFRNDAYQRVLDLESSPLVVTPECCFTYDPYRYPISRPYRGLYEFTKHYYAQVGDFDSSEELEYAQFLDTLPEVKVWVRNPSRSSKAFWLQTSTDKFYPDFVCSLNDGKYLVVEYKGADRWDSDDSKEKRTIGELWEKRSNGTCLFVMPRGKDFEVTRSKISSK